MTCPKRRRTRCKSPAGAAELDAKTEDFVQRNLRWNFSVNLIDITFITLAFSLISRETIMPLLISNLTDSKIAIGLEPAIHSICFYLPQLFAANHTERLKRKLPFVMLVGGVVERLPYFFLALAIGLLALTSPNLTLLIVYAVIALTAFGAGVATPAWYTMIGKVIPVNRRGIFSGIGHGLGALMGIFGAVLVGIALDEFAYPQNFAALFLAAAVFMGISWGGLALNREPASPSVKEQISQRQYFRQLPAVLGGNANFRRFLFAYSISRLGLMGASFFIVFGNERFALIGAEVGLLTAVLLGSQAVMQLALGWLGDRRGHKLNLTIFAFAVALAAALATVASDIRGLLPAFALLGTALAADRISHLNIVLEFALPEDQPTFIGLTNTLLAPVVFLAPIIGGWVADIGFEPLFALMLVCGVIGGALLQFWVKEPRHHPPRALAPPEHGG
ncbi:MAG: MFS transporter [Chloroflexi bacterium]|nr:MFS transporter [Chloroflexota bacterium]MYA94408.1 MFS transporter [Chloroflexota bacterium]MYC56532.1 MFS transporter [Chloroflexota bacterium]MYD37749.1 MFS transporter [Chloroflexota bacterium]MYH66414.1 MFS transporter [Chloroflexota bacterium]